LSKHTPEDRGWSEKEVDVSTVENVRMFIEKTKPDTKTGITNNNPNPNNNGVINQGLNSKLKDLYSQCKDGKVGCMGIPERCVGKFLKDSNTPCTVMVSWSSPDGIRNSYLLTGTSGNPTGGYVAMAFSDDDAMVERIK